MIRLSFTFFLLMNIAAASARGESISINDFAKAQWRVRDVAANSQWMSAADAAAKLHLNIAPSEGLHPCERFLRDIDQWRATGFGRAARPGGL